MKNLILTGLVSILTISLSFAQLKVVAPDGNVNLGDVSRIDNSTNQFVVSEKLNVGGNLNVTGTKMDVGLAGGTAAIKLAIGRARTAGGNAIIEVWGQPNKSKPTGKLIANSAGVTSFTHDASGQLQFKTQNATPLQLKTKNRTRVIITADGKVGIGGGAANAPAYALQVEGSAAKTGGGSWSNPSDKRLKENIQPYELGLSSILKLNPVTYNYNGEGGITDTKTKQVGLIAQEYQKIAPDAVKEYTYTEMIELDDDAPMKKGKSEEYLSINTSQITFMLVNAMKEQQKVIAELQEEVRTLKSSGVTTNNISSTSLVLTSSANKAMIAQNTPNPFSTSTKIEYYVPENASDAVMSFTDISGKEIKRLPLNIGMGNLDVSIKEMPIGIYSYSLIVDGSTIATKKMVLSR